jgi:TPR repeat protein
VSIDEVEALHWFRRAAEAGRASAMRQLGLMYEEGRGVAKDETQALEWYRKAAAAGSDEAREALSRLGR